MTLKCFFFFFFFLSRSLSSKEILWGNPILKKESWAALMKSEGDEWCFWSSWHRGPSLAKFNLPRWWLSILSLTTSSDQSFFTTKLLPFSVQLKVFQIFFFPLSPDKPSYHPLALSADSFLDTKRGDLVHFPSEGFSHFTIRPTAP